MNVLFVTFDGGGNLPPALGLARELARRGDTVRFLGHKAQRSSIEKAGFAFAPYEEGHDYDSAAARSTVTAVRDLTRLFADRGIARDIASAAMADPPDAVVIDCLLWAALDSAQRDGLPVVALVHSLWGYFRDLARGPIGMLARLRGVDPVAAFEGPERVLVTTRTDFEPDVRAPEFVHHLGMVWQDPPVAALADSDRPRVLLSFSSTHIPGQAAALQRALDALAGLPIEIVATTGAVDPASLRAPAGAQVLRRADHGELLPRTALVIGHGGHATTARALAHGIPLLVLPMHPLMDQPAVGAAVERLGVGRVLPKSASPARIRAAVTQMLSDEGVRGAAARLGGSIRERDGASVGADLLHPARTTSQASPST